MAEEFQAIELQLAHEAFSRAVESPEKKTVQEDASEPAADSPRARVAPGRRVQYLQIAAIATNVLVVVVGVMSLAKSWHCHVQ